MSSPFVAPPVVKAKSLTCPSCGAAGELRGFGRALTFVCPACLSVLDTSSPQVKAIAKIQEAQRITPVVPLGSRGKLGGVEWDVAGFQTRGVDGEYEWNEYLLFNPYKGFCYLTEFNGHWNFVKPLEPAPLRTGNNAQPFASFEGLTYKHFSGCNAATDFVIGEFPWRVKVGERVRVDDYVHPPDILSAETTADEIIWSKGQYVTGAEVWSAFKLPGSPPPTRGIFLNQPSPYAGKVGGIWRYCGWMIIVLIALAAGFYLVSSQKVVFHDSYFFSAAQTKETSFVTSAFDLPGRPASVELGVKTNLDNDWAYFNFGLVNEATGTALNFGREVSYYHGTDSDGSYTEGSTSSTVMIPAVEPGRYYLWVEPEMDTSGRHSMNYELTLKHDVPNPMWFWIAALLLLIPPIFYTYRSRKFEISRWMDSDHPPIRRSSGGDD